MEIFNIGILEILFIAVLALVLLGPDELVNNMRKAGRWAYKFFKSSYWRTFLDVKQEISEMPTKLIREAGLEESLKEANKTVEEINKQNLLAHLEAEPRIRTADRSPLDRQTPVHEGTETDQQRILPPLPPDSGGDSHDAANGK
ncbi:MAG: hypothetical protein HPY76_07760 [Anaerolineae bacterium]|jgi:Sec-independent protein translocase protein TatA|nr:hypothetical protein [Anaerolineae bacterium]